MISTVTSFMLSATRKLAHRNALRRSLILMLTATGSTMAAPTGAAPAVERAPGYVKSGGGLPAVVLQAGLQDDSSSWQAILPQLAGKHTVVAINRAGHAGNPATDSLRDPCAIADEQRMLLKQTGLAPPYVLVGHSLGGLYQYVYAKLYPTEVAAMVLLDPTHPRHWESLQREAPGAAMIVKTIRITAFSRTDRAEFDAQAACLDRLNMDAPLQVPVRMLVSERFRPGERGAPEAVVRALRKDWLRLLGTDRMQTVWDSGHYLQKESPDEVIAAIEEVIRHAR